MRDYLTFYGGYACQEVDDTLFLHTRTSHYEHSPSPFHLVISFYCLGFTVMLPIYTTSLSLIILLLLNILFNSSISDSLNDGFLQLITL